MDQVPKVLRPLVQEWTPEGYIVSFKVREQRRAGAWGGVSLPLRSAAERTRLVFECG